MWGTSQGDRTLIGAEADLIRQSVGHMRDMITAGIDSDEPFQSDVGVFNRLQPTQQLAVLHEVAYGLLDPSTPILELTSVREATVYAIYRELVSLIEMEIELERDGVGFGDRFGDAIDGNYSGELRYDESCDFREIESCDLPTREGGDLRTGECNDFLDRDGIDPQEGDRQLNQESPGPDFNSGHKSGLRIRSSTIAACLSFERISEEWDQDEFEHRDSDSRVLPAVESKDLEQWSDAIEFLSDLVLWDRDFEMEEIFADHDPAKIADIKKYLGIHADYFSTPAPDAYSEEYQRLDRELVRLTQLTNL